MITSDNVFSSLLLITVFLVVMDLSIPAQSACWIICVILWAEELESSRLF